MSDSEAVQIRRILAAASKPMTVGEIFAECDTIENTTRIASTLHYECHTGRAERTGERGAYRYQITDAGREALTGVAPRRTTTRGAKPAKAARPDAPPTPAAEATLEPPRAHVDPLPPPAPDDFACRLAALTVVHWPAALSTIPEPLMAQITRALAMESR